MISLIVIALTIQYTASYILWPSRWNIPAHLALGFSVTAYIVPGLLTNVWDNFSPEVIKLYEYINITGAFFLVVGFLAAKKINIELPFFRKLHLLFRESSPDFIIIKKTQRIVLIGIIGMIAAYSIMGFIPMFADDPLSAKQFKGDYFERYYRAAYIFRGSFWLLTATLPISLIIWWQTKKRQYLLYSVLSVVLIAVSLARQSTAIGVLTFIGLIAAQKRKWFIAFIVFVSLIFPLGSAAYLVVGILTGVEAFTSIYSLDSVFDIVGSGSPDIYDQLSLLTGFINTENFTYGRTFYGGLIPGNYLWNPSVWTLTYDDLGADISDQVSGGLRLSMAMWGYVSFGWIGAVMVPLISGFFSGLFIRSVKNLPFEKSLLASALVIMLLLTLGHQISEFYFLSIHNMPAIFCIVYIIKSGLQSKNELRIKK